jgi:hypothetical protein
MLEGRYPCALPNDWPSQEPRSRLPQADQAPAVAFWAVSFSTGFLLWRNMGLEANYGHGGGFAPKRVGSIARKH